MDRRFRCDRCGRRTGKPSTWNLQLSHDWQQGILAFECAAALCPKCGAECRNWLSYFIASDPETGGKMLASRTQLHVNTLMLERARIKKRLSKQELAKLAGRTPTAYSRLLDGTHKNIDFIYRLCEKLGLKFERVVEVRERHAKGTSEGLSQIDANQAKPEED